MLREGEFRFLPPAAAGDSEGGLLCQPDVRAMTSVTSRLISTPAVSTPESLPVDHASPICHLLFRLIEASVWHGYFFLAGWHPALAPDGDGGGGGRAPSPPPAASVEEIKQAYAALLQDTQPQRNTTTEAGDRTAGGMLRCQLCCEFRTNSTTALRAHLTGAGGVNENPAKCALCCLPVLHNRQETALCSVKAHLLFHLDLFLICPQCGFTVSPSSF